MPSETRSEPQWGHLRCLYTETTKYVRGARYSHPSQKPTSWARMTPIDDLIGDDSGFDGSDLLVDEREFRAHPIEVVHHHHESEQDQDDKNNHATFLPPVTRAM